MGVVIILAATLFVGGYLVDGWEGVGVVMVASSAILLMVATVMALVKFLEDRRRKPTFSHEEMERWFSEQAKSNEERHR